jgi:hypothetical protein
MLPWLMAALASTGCQQLESIPYSPRQTPESWLRIQPFVEVHIGSTAILVVQPTTTAIVYLLGIVAIGAGLHFLRVRDGHRSRLWWGIALPLWGIGALLAGTSYEAFSYQIKCAGRAACLWTSWWEIAYLAVSAASADAILIAQAHACATAGWRRAQMLYAFTHIVLYTIALLTGALVPVPFLISFEFLLIVFAPGIVMLAIQNGRRYFRLKRSLDVALLGAWAWLALTIGAYYLYLVSGVTQRLWARQIWFSENDVLHIGLIVWMVYLVRVVAPRIEDHVRSARGGDDEEELERYQERDGDKRPGQQRNRVEDDVRDRVAYLHGPPACRRGGVGLRDQDRIRTG